MGIQQLQTEDQRYSVPAVHPRLAVIKASSVQRAGLVAAGQKADAVIATRSDVDAVLAADTVRRQAAHDLAVDNQQARLAAATTNHTEAGSREENAVTRRTAAAHALAAFDELLAETAQADTRRLGAWADRRCALLSFVDAIDQLEAVEVQWRTAASTLKEAEARFQPAGHTEPRRPQGATTAADDRPERELQDHIAAVQEALDKAEKTRQSELVLAEEQLTEALAEVTAANAALTEAWDRLGHMVGETLLDRRGHGDPDSDRLAHHRDRLLAAAAATERDASLATVAVLSADRHRAEETRRLEELDGETAHSARTLDVVLGWLTDLATTHATTGAPVILDDAFGGIDDAARTGVLAMMVALSTGTQLLYLTDQLVVLAWAISLPHDVGGINYVAATDRPVLAFTE